LWGAAIGAYGADVYHFRGFGRMGDKAVSAFVHPTRHPQRTGSIRTVLPRNETFDDKKTF
jgi:hypothetical protein